MFGTAFAFNQPLDSWDVASCTDMKVMFGSTFRENQQFNQPLENWNVSRVVNMLAMFKASNFNQPLDAWNVSSATDMKSMFKYANNFNQCLSSWAGKTQSTVKTTDMLKDSGCAIVQRTPDPNIGPWCQGGVLKMKIVLYLM